MTVHELHPRLTEVQYDRERDELRQLYGDSSAEAATKRDQSMAKLFHRSGWTQEELARKEGRDRSYVARRLTFGRFLNFVPMGTNEDLIPAGLTERRFREYWEQTDKMAGNERQRFTAVMKAMAEHAKIGPPRSRKGIPDKIRETFGDGRWHTEDEIVRHFADEYPDEDVRNALADRANRNGPTMRVEREKHGRNFRYRIFRQTRLISSNEISAKLRPLIDGLKQEGKKNMATISIGSVARLAALLERQLDEWVQDPAPKANTGEER